MRPPKLVFLLRTARARLLGCALICLLPVSAVLLAQRAADIDRIRGESAARATALADQLNTGVLSKLRALESVAHVIVALDVSGSGDRTCHQPLSHAADAANLSVLNLSVLDADGDVLCSAMPAEGAHNFADRVYFRQALTSGLPTLSDYTFGRVTRAPSVQLAVPRVEEGRKVTHVAVVAVRPAALIADMLPQPKSDVMFGIFDRNGAQLARHPTSAALPPGHVFEGALDLLRANDGRTFRTRGPDGVIREYAARSIRYRGETAMWVLAGVDVAPAEAAAAESRRQTAAVLLVVLAVLAGIAWLIHAEGQRQQAEMQRELENLVARRTRELEAANADLREFSQSISHDLKAPIHTIANFAQVLSERPLPWGEKERHYLSRIHAASLHGGELIEGLLSLSNIARCELDPHDVDLVRLARESLDALNASRVQFSAPPAIVVRGDRRLLKILMDNLVGNAVKFSAACDQPSIRLWRRVEGGHEVFSIRDNGVGFDERYAGKLFQPFHRLHGASEFPGTGLGLATVHKVVARHGGRVWAESKLGQGTTVSFTLWTERGAAVPQRGSSRLAEAVRG